MRKLLSHIFNKFPSLLLEPNVHYRVHKNNPIVSTLRQTNPFNFMLLEFKDPFYYYLPTYCYFFQVNS